MWAPSRRRPARGVPPLTKQRPYCETPQYRDPRASPRRNKRVGPHPEGRGPGAQRGTVSSWRVTRKKAHPKLEEARLLDAGRNPRIRAAAKRLSLVHGSGGDRGSEGEDCYPQPKGAGGSNGLPPPRGFAGHQGEGGPRAQVH